MDYEYLITAMPTVITSVEDAALKNKSIHTSNLAFWVNSGAKYLYLKTNGTLGGAMHPSKTDRLVDKSDFIWALQNYPDTSWTDPNWKFPTVLAIGGQIVTQTADSWYIQSPAGFTLMGATNDHDCLQHVVSYGTRRGFCRKCDRDLAMDDTTLEWKHVR